MGMKILGAVLVTIASWMVGWSARQGLTRRLGLLRQFRLALELMQSEMELNMVSVPELFEAVGQHLGGVLGDFFMGTGVQMAAVRGRPPITAMKLQLEQQASPFEKEEEGLLLELSTALGRYDLDGQARALELYKRQVDQLIAEAEVSKKQKAKAWMTASLCTGLALVVILL